MRIVLLVLASLAVVSCSDCDVTITWQEGKACSDLSSSDTRFVFEVDSLANVCLTCVGENLDKEPVVRLRGTSTGSFTYKAKTRSTILLDNLHLTAGAGNTPISLKNKKSNTLVLAAGTVNTLRDAPQVCDTVASKDCFRCKGDLYVKGEGELRLLATHVGSKGLKCDKSFYMISGKLDVHTSGMYLAEDSMPPMPTGPMLPQMAVDGQMMPPMPAGPPPFLVGDGQQMPAGQMPPMGPPPGGFGQMPPFPFDSLGAFPPPFVRHSYHGTSKGIKVAKHFVMTGGELSIFTETGGAEGLEAKKGVTISGGILHIEAYDDGISTDGPVLINGGDIYVKSLHNDGIDTNLGKEGSYEQNGGNVVAISLAGPPENGVDTDWMPKALRGGTLVDSLYVEPKN